MPSYVIRNSAYRDNILQVPYPFDAFFLGEFDDLQIDNDIFLDAQFYFKTATVLPVSLTSVDGTHGEEDEVHLTFSDDVGENVGVCVFQSGATRAVVYSPVGVEVGILVLDPLGSGRFVSSVQGRFYSLVPGDATFHIDTCKVSKTAGLRYVATEAAAAFGDVVKVVARKGVQWSRDGDTLSLDLLGELPGNDTDRAPVLSVNGVTNPTIWLHTTPESNLRIETKEALIFNQAKDITS